MYRPPGSTGPIVGSIGGLAVTGVDIAWWIALGIVLLIAGLFVLRMAGRRRAASRATEPAVDSDPRTQRQ